MPIINAFRVEGYVKVVLPVVRFRVRSLSAPWCVCHHRYSLLLSTLNLECMQKLEAGFIDGGPESRAQALSVKTRPLFNYFQKTVTAK